MKELMFWVIETAWNLSVLLIVSDDESQWDEDELLAKALEESWNVGSPPQSPPSPPAPPHPPPPRSLGYGYESFVPPYPFYQPAGYR